MLRAAAVLLHAAGPAADVPRALGAVAAPILRLFVLCRLRQRLLLRLRRLLRAPRPARVRFGVCGLPRIRRVLVCRAGRAGRSRRCSGRRVRLRGGVT